MPENIRNSRLVTPPPTRLAPSRRGDAHATRATHGKDPRRQAPEPLELEIHLRRDRRILPDADHRGAARPDEADEAAGAIRREAVRARQGRGGDAQRGAVSRLAADRGADRSADLPVL